MQWGDDMPWGLGGTDSEIDEEDLETFTEKRKVSSKIGLLKLIQPPDRCLHSAFEK